MPFEDLNLQERRPRANIAISAFLHDNPEAADAGFEQVAIQTARALLVGCDPDDPAPPNAMRQMCESQIEIRTQYAISVLSAAHADQPMG